MAGQLANFPSDVHVDSSKLTALRRLTLRMAFPHVNFRVQDSLSVAISTITSPVFREFVLEFTGSPHYNCLTTRNCGVGWSGCDWDKIDKPLEEQFAGLGDFRMVIRTEKLQDPKHFQGHAETAFRLLASRGCIWFETPSL